jgi:hypothetical protein
MGRLPRLGLVSAVLGALAVAAVVRASPSGTLLLKFDVQPAPLSPTTSQITCRSVRVVSTTSDARSPEVRVTDAEDPMGWVAKIKVPSITITTRNGYTGSMKVTYKDRDTLRAVSDTGVAEALTIDFRSGRAVFATLRNLNLAEGADNELMGRIHYMVCQAVSDK